MDSKILPYRPYAAHLNDRLVERLAGKVSDPESLLAAAWDFCQKQSYDTSVAMKVSQLETVLGDPRHYHPNRESNGDEVWVVARRRKLVTVMFRRSSQPKVCGSFDTNLVVDLTAGLPTVCDSTAEVVFRKRV